MRDKIVGMFPKGNRTPDGEVQPLKPGFAVLARRAGVPLLLEETRSHDSRGLVAEVERRIRACRAEARRRWPQREAV